MKHNRYVKVSVHVDLMEEALKVYAERHNQTHITYAEVMRAALRVYLENDETADYPDP